MGSSRVFTAIFAGVFPFIGITLLVISFLVYRSNERERETGIHTTGNVVGMHEYYDSEGSMYAPIVRFTTTKGEVVEFTSSTRSRPAEYGPGDAVQVLYQPDAPHDAEIDTAFGRYFAPMLLGGVGLGLGLVGAIVAFVVNRFLF